MYYPVTYTEASIRFDWHLRKLEETYKIEIGRCIYFCQGENSVTLSLSPKLPAEVTELVRSLFKNDFNFFYIIIEYPFLSVGNSVEN